MAALLLDAFLNLYRELTEDQRSVFRRSLFPYAFDDIDNDDEDIAEGYFLWFTCLYHARYKEPGYYPSLSWHVRDTDDETTAENKKKQNRANQWLVRFDSCKFDPFEGAKYSVHARLEVGAKKRPETNKSYKTYVVFNGPKECFVKKRNIFSVDQFENTTRDAIEQNLQLKMNELCQQQTDDIELDIEDQARECLTSMFRIQMICQDTEVTYQGRKFIGLENFCDEMRKQFKLGFISYWNKPPPDRSLFAAIRSVLDIMKKVPPIFKDIFMSENIDASTAALHQLEKNNQELIRDEEDDEDENSPKSKKSAKKKTKKQPGVKGRPRNNPSAPKWIAEENKRKSLTDAVLKVNSGRAEELTQISHAPGFTITNNVTGETAMAPYFHEQANEYPLPEQRDEDELRCLNFDLIQPHADSNTFDTSIDLVNSNMNVSRPNDRFDAMFTSLSQSAAIPETVNPIARSSQRDVDVSTFLQMTPSKSGYVNASQTTRTKPMPSFMILDPPVSRPNTTQSKTGHAELNQEKTTKGNDSKKGSSQEKIISSSEDEETSRKETKRKRPSDKDEPKTKEVTTILTEESMEMFVDMTRLTREFMSVPGKFEQPGQVIDMLRCVSMIFKESGLSRLDFPKFLKKSLDELIRDEASQSQKRRTADDINDVELDG